MSYATPSDLITWYGARELAELSVPDDLATVTPELLRLTIDSGDRSGYGAAEQAAADAALARLEAAIADAGRLMDGYLHRRHTLPLAVETVAASGLPRCCGVLARHLLQDDQATPEAQRRHTQAIAWLRELAAGMVDLEGAASPAAGTGAGRVDYYQDGQRLFDDDALKGFL